MKFKKRCIAIFMVICIILSLSLAVAFADSGGSGETLENIPGVLILDKTWTHTPGTDSWEITVSLNGLDQITTTDIVLLVDTSKSMDDYNRMDNTKIAAGEFVEALIKDQTSPTKIALVTFNSDAALVSDFTDDKTNLLNLIDGLSTDEGAHIQSGIRTATQLLDASSAQNKYIVLLGDGAPTYSYNISGIDNLGITYCHWWSYGTVFSRDFIMSFHYDQTVGNGMTYAFPDRPFAVYCSVHNSNHNFIINSNGESTIFESNLTKAKGIEIYAVALNPDVDGQAVLSNSSSGPGYYYKVDDNDLSGLTAAFTEIAGEIAFAATDVVVNDPIGDMFTLDSDTIVVKMNGVIDRNADFQVTDTDEGRKGQKIIWNISSVSNASSPITMTYTVQIQSDTDARTNYAINGPATVDYTDADGNRQHRDFFVPEVNSGDFGTVLIKYYLADKDGYALTEQGQRASKIEDVHFLHQAYYEKDGFTSHHGDHEIHAPLIMNFTIDGNEINGVFVSGDLKNLGNESPSTVSLNVADRQQYLYFAYMETELFSVTYHENTESKQTVSDMPENLTVVLSGTLIAEPDDPISDGYEFEGWYSDADCLMQWYFDLDKVVSDIDLYAKWTFVGDTKYTVTFNADGGTPVPKVQTVQYGNSAEKPADPAKAGHDFVEWQLDEKIYDFGTQVTTKIELKAVYKINDATFQVTFDTNGGTPVPEAQTVEIHGFAEIPVNPAKTGHDFIEWQVDGVAFDFDNTRITSDLDLVALYEINNTVYTVIFDSAGGSTVSEQLIQIHAAAVQPSPDPVRSGYRFVYWYDQAETADQEWDFAAIITSDITLAAKWSKISDKTDDGGVIFLSQEDSKNDPESEVDETATEDSPESGFDETSAEDNQNKKEDEPPQVLGKFPLSSILWFILLLALLCLVGCGYYDRKVKNN